MYHNSGTHKYLALPKRTLLNTEMGSSNTVCYTTLSQCHVVIQMFLLLLFGMMVRLVRVCLILSCHSTITSHALHTTIYMRYDYDVYTLYIRIRSANRPVLDRPNLVACTSVENRTNLFFPPSYYEWRYFVQNVRMYRLTITYPWTDVRPHLIYHVAFRQSAIRPLVPVRRCPLLCLMPLGSVCRCAGIPRHSSSLIRTYFVAL